MKQTVLIFSLVAFAGAAWAASEPASRSSGAGQHFAKLDADGNGSVSRDEAKGHARLEKGFDTLDTNKDGQLSQDELRAYAATKREKRGERQAQMKQRWEAADANQDGQLSQAEAEQGAPQLAKHFAKLDANGDGLLSTEEIQSSMKSHRSRKAQ